MLVQKALRPSFLQFNKICDEGITAKGDELAVKGLHKTYCGDLSFLQKVMHRGGACKSKEYFCCHCACNGTLDLMTFKTGNERCRICLHNNREQCNHIDVCDKEEMQRQYTDLINSLVIDQRRHKNDETLTLRDLMPKEPVPCFKCYNDKGEIETELVDLREYITDEGIRTRHARDYCAQMTHIEESKSVTAIKDKVLLLKDAVQKLVDHFNIEFDVWMYVWISG